MRLNLRQIRITILVVILVLVSGGIGYQLGCRQIKISNTAISEKRNIDFSLFWDVWGRLESSYLNKESLDGQNMVWGAIKGMVASLGDPYTVFLAPEDNKQAKEDLNGEFEGVGIQLDYNNDKRLVVVAPLGGMPAEKAGVRAGDLILKIDDKETDGMTLPEAVKLIRGPKDTKVKLTLLHKEEKDPYEVTITRETIIVPSVEVKLINNVTHLKLMRFGDKTNEEWKKAVEEIVERCRGAEVQRCRVILDLRNNPGGYLSGAVFIASEFLPSGVVVQQESAKGIKETFSVNRRGLLTSQPLVVLVNEGSASASEIVAGALQDYNRAKIVGLKTFGKGTIQEAQDLPNGSGLHVTTARWLLPKGRSIEKAGVVPDFEVKDDPKTEKDEQLEKAVEILIKS